MFAAVVALLFLFLSTQYLSQQPFFNAKVVAKDGSVWIQDADGEPHQITGLLYRGKDLSITPKDISDDPDFIRTFEEFELYFSHQSELYKALRQPRVSFSSAASEGEVLVLEQQTRSVKDLPLTFWMLQVYGMLALFTGLAFWAYHRRQAVTRVLALGGVGCYVMQTSQSIYASRELALHGDHFQWLIHINHFGGMLFVFGLVMLLWFYPKPIQRPRLALLFSFITLAVWANELVQWIEWPISLFYFPAIILITFTGVLLYKQWLRCRTSPKYRRLYLWLVYSILAGLGLTFAVYIVPILVMGKPLVSTWIANTFCLLVFLGFVLGVNYGGLFSVERWWLKACFNVLIAIFVILMDLLAIALLGTEAALGFSVIAVVSFWIYLWLRSKLWVFVSGNQNREITLANMMIDQASVGDKVSADTDQKESIPLLESLYQPLAVNVVDQAYAKPKVRDHGFKLCVTVPKGDYHISFEFIGKNKGQKIFTEHDCEFITNYLEHIKSLEALYKEKEATLLHERDRIMRDLHDEVAAHLLGVVHAAKDSDVRQQAQHCLKNLREIVYSMDDTKSRSLLDAIAKWRYEISQLIESAAINLAWQDDVIQQDIELNGAQWLQLSKILRELVANGIKHGAATDIAIAFVLNQNHLEITVTNNGVSESEGSNDWTTWKHGKGLKSIERRAKELFGTVVWQVQNNQCQATVSIPV